MKHRETKTEAKEVTEVVKSWETCDICGAELGGLHGNDISESEVSLRTGYSYPDCGSTTTVSADLCAQCFETKLIPWLEIQGVTMQREECSW